MHSSLQESSKIFRFEKFKDWINLIDKNISDLIIECFDRNKSCEEWYFKRLISMKNFLFCTVLLPGASKVDQTRKFDDFLNLTDISDLTIECFNRNKSC